MPSRLLTLLASTLAVLVVAAAFWRGATRLNHKEAMERVFVRLVVVCNPKYRAPPEWCRVAGAALWSGDFESLRQEGAGRLAVQRLIVICDPDNSIRPRWCHPG